MDANKHPQEQDKEQVQATRKPRAKGAVGSRRFFSKRWVYPAIYLGAAALIIGLMYVKSQVGSSPATSNVVETPTGAQTAATETFQWPAAASVNPKVTLGFFGDKAAQTQQAKSLVVYDNGYYPHMGYDIQAANKQAFNVQAAVSGKVTSVSNNPLYGNIVEVTTSNGYLVEYQSLASVKVKQGDTVKQGQVLGTSGTCVFEKSQGNHLYFAVYKSGNPVDPSTILPKL